MNNNIYLITVTTSSLLVKIVLLLAPDTVSVFKPVRMEIKFF